VERDVGCLEERGSSSEELAERWRLGTVREIVLLHLAEALREAMAGGDLEAARVCHETLGRLLARRPIGEPRLCEGSGRVPSSTSMSVAAPSSPVHEDLSLGSNTDERVKIFQPNDASNSVADMNLHHQPFRVRFRPNR